MSALRHSKCNLCGADNPRDLFVSWNMWQDAGNRERECFSFVECSACKLVYLDPHVHPEEIGAYYVDGYHSHAFARSESNTQARHSKRQAGWQSGPSSLPGRRIIVRPLSKLAGCTRFITSIGRTWSGKRAYRWRKDLYEDLRDEGSRKVGMAAPWLPVFSRTVCFRHDPLAFPGSGRRLLDVGCGVGDYLSHKQTLGWDAYGVEPSGRAAEICLERGLRVRHGYLDPTDWGESAFDVVTLLHVIEHLPDPQQTLRQTYRVLKPGGLIYIRTPNWRSIAARLFRTYWIGADAPRHYFLFTPSTLSKILVRAGLVPKRWYTQSSVQGYTAAIEFILRECFTVNLARDSVRKHRILSRLFIPWVRFVDWFNLGDNLHMLALRPG